MRQRVRAHLSFVVVAAALASALIGLIGAQTAPGGAPPAAPTASGWTLVKFTQPQPACTGFGFIGAIYYDRNDCGFGFVQVTETTEDSSVSVEFLDPDENVLDRQDDLEYRSDDEAWEFAITPESDWPAGEITIRVVKADAAEGNLGETTFFLNVLGATVGVVGSDHEPGDEIDVAGEIFEIDQVPPLAAPVETGVPATFRLQVRLPDGSVRGPYPATGTFTADSDGDFSETLPGAATAGLTAGAETNYQVGVSIEVIDAAYDDALTGEWAADRAGAGALVFTVPPTGLVIENSFVSAEGWVKPDEAYPFRVLLRNYQETAATDVGVTIPAADGMAFLTATSAAGTVTPTAALITWSDVTVPAATDGGPGLATLVVQAQADSLAEDPQVVWKNLSTTATISGGASSESQGPKVIPPKQIFDTARYGFRPFPVVPVDYFDRAHEEQHTGQSLANKINSPAVAGSTYNLYQEMSYGQLSPHGTVPSAGLATAEWAAGQGTRFTDAQPQGTCKGGTFKALKGTPAYSERIREGWYQLPGDTEYYGGDRFGSALPGAIVGVGPLMDIDSACGPTGKAVYDAAHIADPDIDYSDYDTDKDGVVDFFMMVFVGAGGNGVSQTSVPPYDNIWPHSSSLEFYYSDEDTGLKGYISEDQLKDLEGFPLWYTNASRGAMTRSDMGDELKVMVRVGPYNVNPETAIDKASVISHEYGHSLGLPDFYSLGSRETYGDWTLMATDKSQHMDVFSKQELGWIVPRVLEPGESSTASDWPDSKENTHQIDWQQPDGTPYTLSGPNVDNGAAYVAALPKRLLIDPAKVEAGASPTHVWWSQSGNDFGCPPNNGHNLDVFLPELADVGAGTPVTLTFKSYWDIEWDFDYGYVMISTDGGQTYQALPSQNGYTTDRSFNPNANSCQTQFSNGLTGTSGSYAAGTQASDRLLGTYPEGGFLADEYDLSSAAGHQTVLRFSYSTDAGLARPGWFIDDVEVAAGGNVVYSTDFEQADDSRLFNGGCRGTERVAQVCTVGWQYVDSAGGSPADHAYYLEMRDRSGFDNTGRNENDRDPIQFGPGLLLVYTDETHGYGNVGTADPPAQTPLDSQPQPGNRTPNLHDAAFTDASGDGSYSDFGAGHTDNYTDPESEDELWHLRFNCLSFQVQSMTGEETMSDTVPGDLTGDVSFTLGTGCGQFDYGHLPAAPQSPGQASPQPGATQAGPCTITGTEGPDILRGTPGPDVICALGGNDVVYGGRGNDIVRAGRGKDVVYGGRGADRLFGNAGPDWLRGQGGRDTLVGGRDRDRMSGGAGRDTLNGHEHPVRRDVLNGGTGADRCRANRPDVRRAC
jgi:immune inhibitor A